MRHLRRYCNTLINGSTWCQNTAHYSISAENVATKEFNLSHIITESNGILGTLDYALYFKNQETNEYISPWHHIPMLASTNGNEFHYVHEISKGERRKMEVQTKLPYNPIKQDVKNGKPREFSYGDLPFNYGCIPQTWEDPSHSPMGLDNLYGDNDPLDVVEISSHPLELGKIYKVKVLGVIALIDQGEIDWKILAIRTDDKLAPELNNITHVGEKLPNLLQVVFHWFKYYKITDGKSENEFALGARAKDFHFANQVIQDTHKSWQKLVKNNTTELWTPNL
jgi:inorganic pyrophosphatase